MNTTEMLNKKPYTHTHTHTDTGIHENNVFWAHRRICNAMIDVRTSHDAISGTTKRESYTVTD